MLHKPLISVIIPIYGVEKFIERCARSLFEQTIDDIEYIFVNDCTKDNSIVILERIIEDYPQREKQITILHHKINKGLPQARKTGIMHAKGEYIAHCDSDDWIEKDMYKSLYDIAQERKADIVFCDMYKNTSTKEYVIRKFKRRNIEKEDVMKGLLIHNITGNVFSYIAHKSLYENNIIFPPGNMMEDWCLTVQLVYFCCNISYVRVPFYHYFYNTTSLTNTNVQQEKCIAYFEQRRDNICTVYNFLANNKEEKYQDLRISSELMNIFSLEHFVNNKNIKDLWTKTYPNVNLINVFFSQSSVKFKLKYLLVCCGLYSLLYKIIKKSKSVR